MTRSLGIHHVTAFASDPAQNADFYRNVLGLRLIKKTINYDDPRVYHLYYGDEVGSPGTALTFFPRLGAKTGIRGGGEVSETSFSVPPGSLTFWQKRFAEMKIVQSEIKLRFGENCLAFVDPDGMSLALVEQAFANTIMGESRMGIPSENAIRGFSNVTLQSVKPQATETVLSLLGYQKQKSEGAITRWSSRHIGRATDIDISDGSGSAYHQSGSGSVHHVAIAAVDDAAQVEMAESIRALGISVTEQKDRNYFRSIYFREPGGILFEIATLGPGFSVDEPVEQLGESLMLPPWLEQYRADIEATLPPLAAQSYTRSHAAA